MTDADLSPNEYRPPRRVALLAAVVIASMSIIGLWRGISEELRVGRQAAYLETFTRTHPATPLPAVGAPAEAESLPAAGGQTVAPTAEPEPAPDVAKAEKAEKAEPASPPAPPAERAVRPAVQPAPPSRAEPAPDPEPSAVDRILEEERRRDEEPPPPEEPEFDPYLD